MTPSYAGVLSSSSPHTVFSLVFSTCAHVNLDPFTQHQPQSPTHKIDVLTKRKVLTHSPLEDGGHESPSPSGPPTHPKIQSLDHLEAARARDSLASHSQGRKQWRG